MLLNWRTDRPLSSAQVHFLIDLKKLQYPENKQKRLDQQPLINLLIDDCLYSGVQQIKDVSGLQDIEILPRLKFYSNHLADFSSSMQKLRQMYVEQVKEVDEFIAKSLTDLPPLLSRQKALRESLSLDTGFLERWMTEVSEKTQLMDSKPSLSNNLRYSFYARLVEMSNTLYQKLAFDDWLFKSSNNISFKEDSEPILKLKYDCCVPFQNYLNQHAEHQMPLQHRKTKVVRQLIEEISWLNNPEDIQNIIYNAVKQNSRLHKNSLGKLFESLEGEFQKSLKGVANIVDEYISPKPSIEQRSIS